MRLTKHRKKILELFETSDALLSAEDISQQLKDAQIDLSTIYRAIDVFLRESILSKCTIDNRAYYYLRDTEHHHYMICLTCHKRFKMKCFLDEFLDSSEIVGDFSPAYHDLTIYGYCKNCTPKIK